MQEAEESRVLVPRVHWPSGGRGGGGGGSSAPIPRRRSHSTNSIVSAFLIVEKKKKKKKEKKKRNKSCSKAKGGSEETGFPTSACGRGVFFTVRYPERTPRPVCTGVGASKGEFFYSVWANQLNGWENRRENNHRPVIKLPLVRESVRRGWIWYQGPFLTSDYLEISTERLVATDSFPFSSSFSFQPVNC